ncbi:prephenate dehydrogenase dimerization domain-containing protein [Rhodococcoides corynebacterioides]|uniref:Prephenate dehydrogenase n=1 Tax=Rhodococcoides corynebacterioides TaxID=53972 RepID=A0ABS7P7Z1_9NOCA|nr:prephenate dehydrogenase dimerization domain-containing protein [Rhodococcus corynebacterioides]MBY6368498.1 prephenate dehydrogenase [Rhodococcus corynebacterioides]MBY6409355.1 prephenate dehydrogenase [Rhodococcus corynebacterioides]
MIRRVVVVGGAGAVGALYADAFAGAGCAVSVLDPAADEVGGDVLRPDAAATDRLGAADVVILAVPESVALAAVPVLSTIAPRATVVDTLSVKTAIADAVARSTVVAAVGLNPMYAPSLGMDGRPTAAVVHRDGPAVASVLEVVAARGPVVRVSASEHDRVVASTQALTHAAILAFGTALAELGVDPAVAAALGPPPFATATALLARVATGTPEVYADVQQGNPFAAPARAALGRAVATVDSSCADVAEFTALLATARAALGPELAPASARCADLFDRLRSIDRPESDQEDLQ